MSFTEGNDENRKQQLFAHYQQILKKLTSWSDENVLDIYNELKKIFLLYGIKASLDSQIILTDFQAVMLESIKSTSGADIHPNKLKPWVKALKLMLSTVHDNAQEEVALIKLEEECFINPIIKSMEEQDIPNIQQAYDIGLEARLDPENINSFKDCEEKIEVLHKSIWKIFEWIEKNQEILKKNSISTDDVLHSVGEEIKEIRKVQDDIKQHKLTKSDFDLLMKNLEEKSENEFVKSIQEFINNKEITVEELPSLQQYLESNEIANIYNAIEAGISPRPRTVSEVYKDFHANILNQSINSISKFSGEENIKEIQNTLSDLTPAEIKFIPEKYEPLNKISLEVETNLQEISDNSSYFEAFNDKIKIISEDVDVLSNRSKVLEEIFEKKILEEKLEQLKETKENLLKSKNRIKQKIIMEDKEKVKNVEEIKKNIKEAKKTINDEYGNEKTKIKIESYKKKLEAFNNDKLLFDQSLNDSFIYKNKIIAESKKLESLYEEIKKYNSEDFFRAATIGIDSLLNEIKTFNDESDNDANNLKMDLISQETFLKELKESTKIKPLLANVDSFLKNTINFDLKEFINSIDRLDNKEKKYFFERFNTLLNISETERMIYSTSGIEKIFKSLLEKNKSIEKQKKDTVPKSSELQGEVNAVEQPVLSHKNEPGSYADLTISDFQKLENSIKNDSVEKLFKTVEEIYLKQMPSNIKFLLKELERLVVEDANEKKIDLTQDTFYAHMRLLENVFRSYENNDKDNLAKWQALYYINHIDYKEQFSNISDALAYNEQLNINKENFQTFSERIKLLSEKFEKQALIDSKILNPTKIKEKRELFKSLQAKVTEKLEAYDLLYNTTMKNTLAISKKAKEDFDRCKINYSDYIKRNNEIEEEILKASVEIEQLELEKSELEKTLKENIEKNNEALNKYHEKYAKTELELAIAKDLEEELKSANKVIEDKQPFLQNNMKKSFEIDSKMENFGQRIKTFIELAQAKKLEYERLKESEIEVEIEVEVYVEQIIALLETVRNSALSNKELEDTENNINSFFTKIEEYGSQTSRACDRLNEYYKDPQLFSNLEEAKSYVLQKIKDRMQPVLELNLILENFSAIEHQSTIDELNKLNKNIQDVLGKAWPSGDSMYSQSFPAELNRGLNIKQEEPITNIDGLMKYYNKRLETQRKKIIGAEEAAAKKFVALYSEIPKKDSDLLLDECVREADDILKGLVVSESREIFVNIVNENKDLKVQSLEEINKMFNKKIEDQKQLLESAHELSNNIVNAIISIQHTSDEKDLRNEIKHKVNAYLDTEYLKLTTEGSQKKFFEEITNGFRKANFLGERKSITTSEEISHLMGVLILERQEVINEKKASQAAKTISTLFKDMLENDVTEEKLLDLQQSFNTAFDGTSSSVEALFGEKLQQALKTDGMSKSKRGEVKISTTGEDFSLSSKEEIKQLWEKTFSSKKSLLKQQAEIDEKLGQLGPKRIKRGEELAKNYIKFVQKMREQVTIKGTKLIKKEYNEAFASEKFFEADDAIATVVMIEKINEANIGFRVENKGEIFSKYGDLEAEKIKALKLSVSNEAEKIYQLMFQYNKCGNELEVLKITESIKNILQKNAFQDGNDEERKLLASTLQVSVPPVIRNIGEKIDIIISNNFEKFEIIEQQIDLVETFAKAQLLNAQKIAEDICVQLKQINEINENNVGKLDNDVPHAVENLLGTVSTLTPGAKRFFS